ncbi:MAG: hypothetical protein O3A33_03205 [Chloroflexi bacterium]|nr:hypothetical protein [Chloroflexota bacterium]
MKQLFLRIRLWTVWTAIGLLLLSMDNSGHYLNPAQVVASPYMYNIVQWEFRNFLSKWTHRLGQAFPGDQGQEESLAQMHQYFQLGLEVRELSRDLANAAAAEDVETRNDLQLRLTDANSERDSLALDVEETIEGGISFVLVEEGLSSVGEFIFPPVDIRLGDPPKLLITSPRDRIERTHDVLLRSDVTIQEREAVEGQLLAESNLAALVETIGGLATYPASIPTNQPMHWTFQATAHEWLHHYLFFRPLGQNMFDDGDMVSLNETVASIAGDEIGDRAFVLLGGELPPVVAPQSDEEIDQSIENDEADQVFNFSREMRETRLKVDEFLEAGQVEDAEQYMEVRRQLFVDNGYAIRKLNQAYFAFYGTYADTAASVSPIGDQLSRLRSHMPDVGTFLSTVSRVSSYQEFLDILERLENERP